MPVALQTTIVTEGVSNFRKSDLQRAGKKGLRLMGKLEHRNNIPRKFRNSAHQRYGIEKRKPHYNQRKLKRRRNTAGFRAAGTIKPFVWSGRTKALVLANQKVATKTPPDAKHYVDVIIRAPQLNRIPRVREEMERITEGELLDLGKAGIRRYEKELFRKGRKVTRVIK